MKRKLLPSLSTGNRVVHGYMLLQRAKHKQQYPLPQQRTLQWPMIHIIKLSRPVKMSPWHHQYLTPLIFQIKHMEKSPVLSLDGRFCICPRQCPQYLIHHVLGRYIIRKYTEHKFIANRCGSKRLILLKIAAFKRTSI
jgi:hypothetical protein